MPIPAFRPEDQRAKTGGIIRATRRPAGWIAPGPRPPLSLAQPDDESVDLALWPTPEEDLCWLAGDFRILQRLDGHRWSLDDLMTAWLASNAVSAPKTICDLGCGIGTVLLFCAWRFPGAQLVGLEAQTESAALARRSLVWNDVTSRVQVRSGDLRAKSSFSDDEKFDLVTGTPPYFPPGTGIESGRPQCAPCRFEHRGGVEDYIDAMARILAPGGRAVVCQGTVQAHRVAPAVLRAGLVIEEHLEIVPRDGKPVLVSLYTLARPDDARPTTHRTLCVRLKDGQWTDDFRRVRDELGMPPGRHDT
ncbi:MAG: methyltransferase domain-containing protein [Polyangia bacterium]